MHEDIIKKREKNRCFYSILLLFLLKKMCAR